MCFAASMTKRPVHHTKLATYFVTLREAKGWNQSQAADVAARRHLKVTYQALRGLEDGTTKNPEPDLLRAVAVLYGKTYREVALEVIRTRYRLVDLSADQFQEDVERKRFSEIEDRLATIETKAGALDDEALLVARTFASLHDAHRAVARIHMLMLKDSERVHPLFQADSSGRRPVDLPEKGHNNG